MADSDLPDRVEAIRRFNRFYTAKIGVLRAGLLDSPFTLAEARIIYELAHRGHATATELRGDLSMDRGYLSRLVRSLAKRGVLDKHPSDDDGRQIILSLTEAGEQAFQLLNARSRSEIASLLGPLSAADQFRLVSAMSVIEQLLAPERPAPRAYLLRRNEPGDVGWVIRRHATLYQEEFGWDGSFEGMVAEVATDFLNRGDSPRDRCWIAELEGEPVGSVFIMEKSKTIAQLRLMLVDPRRVASGSARGWLMKPSSFLDATDTRRFSSGPIRFCWRREPSISAPGSN